MDTTGESTRPNLLLRIVGIVLLLAGLALLLGGVYLIVLGGSWYYAPAGLGLTIAGWWIRAGNLNGVRVYMLVFLATVLWTLWEVGFTFWPSVPRLVGLLAIAAVLMLSVPLFPAQSRRLFRDRHCVAVGIVLLFGFGVYFAAMFWPHDHFSRDIALVEGKPSPTTLAAGNDWPNWGRTGGGARYAPFDQITPENIEGLEVAWTARTGYVVDQAAFEQDQNTPLYIDGTLYACAHSGQISAIDGVTGEIKWQFDPNAKSTDWKRCRSIAYFDPGPGDACGPRLVETTVDARLISIKASDGTLCESFGEGGTVDLWIGMAASNDDFEYLTNSSGPIVANGKIVVAGRVTDNIKVGQPSGVIRAYDAKTGAMAWVWDLGQPDLKGLPPEGETYTLGTPNSWSLLSYDEALNMVYVPLGNASPDIWGGKRRPFDDEHSSSVVALDLSTGDKVWHFQTVRHDLWDYDLPAQPVLADIPDGKGGTIPALIQTTKRAQVFVLDRRTGVPIKAVEDRPAPKPDGTIEGDYYAETQPYSPDMAAVGAGPLTETDMWGATPIDQMLCRIIYHRYRFDGEFTTPSTEWSIIWPGPLGGMNYGATTIDERRNLMVAVAMRFPLQLRLMRHEDVPQGAEYTGESGRWHPMEGTPYTMERAGLMSPLGIPCLAPPWGGVAAIDLNSGEQVWQQPAGTAEDLSFGSFQPGLAFYTGIPPLGGPIITGDIAWHAGFYDFYIRAYHVATGEILWEHRLPTGSQATPLSYIGEDGRQYIVISASGGRYNPANWGDYIVAFALPKGAG